MKSKVSKKGLILFALFIGIIGILFYQPSSNTITANNAEFDVDQDIISQAFLNSVINTNVILTDSDQSLIERFLDEQGVGLTEKFGIQTNIALVDSDSNVVDTQSSILGVSQLSVTDEQGNLLDLGAVQVTMKGISQSKETSVNIWGTVEFFLDDDKVDTKKIWASGQNVNTLDLSLVDSLTFDNTNTNSQLDSQIAGHQSKLNIVGTASTAQLRDMANSLNIQFDSPRDVIETELRKEILFLQSQFNSDIKTANPPSFSQQEKKNQTFTLSDEGRNWVDQSEHTYRVVITQVHAKLESDSVVKEFNWSGQNIAYELKVKVNGAKKVILGADNKSLEIFKSDTTLNISGAEIHFAVSSPFLGNEGDFSAIPPLVKITDIDGNLILDAHHSGSYTGIPRGTDIILTINGVDYPYTTSNSQENLNLSASLVQSGKICKENSGSGSGTVSCIPAYRPVVTSNFGYP